MLMVKIKVPNRELYIDVEKIVSMEFVSIKGVLELQMACGEKITFYDEHHRNMDMIIDMINTINKTCLESRVIEVNVGE